MYSYSIFDNLFTIYRFLKIECLFISIWMLCMLSTNAFTIIDSIIDEVSGYF